MSYDVIELLSKRLIEQASIQEAGFAIVLHGGEPLMLGLDRISFLVKNIRQKLEPEKYPISIQTNGSLLCKKYLDFFSGEKVSVSISIDGDQDANDLARVDRKGDSTFIKTLNGIYSLLDHPDRNFLFAGTLTVIQPNISATKTYNFLRSISSPSIDFIMQDGNYDRLPKWKKSFHSTEYGDWLSELFECYVSDQSPVPIRLFDDLMRLLLGGSGTKEGQGTNHYGILIFETDGEIRKNDTLRSSYDGADFFSARWNVQDTQLSEILSSNEYEEYIKMQQPTCESCQSCTYMETCGGGMPLYRWGRSHGYNAPSIYCNDHKKIISFIMSKLI